MTKDRTCPPMGGGSIDLSAIHAADAKGADLTEAVAAATTSNAPQRASDAPAAEPGKREQLLAQATTLGVEVREGATSIEIRAALKAAIHAAAPKPAAKAATPPDADG